MDLPSNIELEIMRVLWSNGPLKPAEIQERLNIEIKNSALRFHLGAMTDKALLNRKKAGKAFLYKARAPKSRVLRELSRVLAGAFSGGSAMAFIGDLIQADGLSAKDIEELRKVAAKSNRAKKKRSRR